MKGSTLCWIGAWGNLCWAAVSLAGMLFGGPHWLPTFVIAMALSAGLAVLGRSLHDEEVDEAEEQARDERIAEAGREYRAARKKSAAKRKAEPETTKAAPSS